MGTTIRAQLSTANPYCIERHRYYELKHFCLQYPIWKKAYTNLNVLKSRPMEFIFPGKTNCLSSSTETCAMQRLYYLERIEMIEQTAIEADSDIYQYLLRGVTEGLSYNYLHMMTDMPCGKDLYYDRYHRFFWLLNRKRQ